MERARWLAGMVLAALMGCQGQPQEPDTRNIRRATAEITGMSPADAYAHLERTAQGGQTVGDLVTLDPQPNVTIQADGIVVGLNGRGTDRITMKQRPHLVKLLVREYGSNQVAGQLLSSRDAAPVWCVAEIPPFARAQDKIDVRVQSMDPMVNLEGGTLVGTPLEQFVAMPGRTDSDFRTPSGLVSAGTKAEARGDVTLNPGYRDGLPLGVQVPNVGYVPGGVLVNDTWGCRLLLKKPDADTALLVSQGIRLRFGQITGLVTSEFVVVYMPDRYVGRQKRYLDVLMRVRVRPASRQIQSLVGMLGSPNAGARYDAECTLEAYGREASAVLLEASRSANEAQRQSALRVLALLNDKRVVESLVSESRSAQGGFRPESARLMSLLGGDVVEQRLTEMLSDEDAMARYEAVLALERLAAKNAPVRPYYSPFQRNFAVYLVEVPGKKVVVVKPLNGIRRIALFGPVFQVKPGFQGEVGPVVLSVGEDSTQLRDKRTGGPEPIPLRTTELLNIVSVLDRMGVSINDIIGLIALMDKKAALGAEVRWTE